MEGPTPVSRLRPIALVLAVALATFFTQLGAARLWDRDEPRNARCAYEMWQRQDWVVPTFNDELRTHKPVLLYWCMMSAYEVFGVSEFAVRFWSAALALVTVAATYALGRRLFDPQAGFWAAIVLATTLMFNVAARAATPDSLLICCCTLALVAYVHCVRARAWLPSLPGGAPEDIEVHEFVPLRFWPAVAVYGAMGLGVLAKGPIGFVLPTAVLGMFLLVTTLPTASPTNTEHHLRVVRWLRRTARVFHPLHFVRTCWRMRLLTALAVCALVAGPWYFLVGVRTEGQWLRGFFWEHNVSRALNTMEGHRGSSLLYYPITLLVGTFPWSVLTIPLLLSLREDWRQRHGRPAYTLLLCWIGVWVAAFSVSQTKLPSYITPTHPAVAVLVGRFLQRLTAIGTSSLADMAPRVRIDAGVDRPGHTDCAADCGTFLFAGRRSVGTAGCHSTGRRADDVPPTAAAACSGRSALAGRHCGGLLHCPVRIGGTASQPSPADPGTAGISHAARQAGAARVIRQPGAKLDLLRQPAGRSAARRSARAGRWLHAAGSRPPAADYRSELPPAGALSAGIGPSRGPDPVLSEGRQRPAAGKRRRARRSSRIADGAEQGRPRPGGTGLRDRPQVVRGSRRGPAHFGSILLFGERPGRNTSWGQGAANTSPQPHSAPESPCALFPRLGRNRALILGPSRVSWKCEWRATGMRSRCTDQEESVIPRHGRRMVIAVVAVVSAVSVAVGGDTTDVAFVGQPFGVARVTLPLDRTESSSAVDTNGYLIRERADRVFYPAFAERRVLGMLRQVLGVSTPSPRTSVTCFFLFTGTESLDLSLFTPARHGRILQPTESEADRAQLLQAWWRQYAAVAQLRTYTSDYPPILEQYLTSTLSRRLGLSVDASNPRFRRPWSLEQESLWLMFNCEAMRLRYLEQTLQAAPLPTPAARVPLPPELAWPAPQVDAVPADVPIEPIARHVPAECFYVRFGSFPNYLWVDRRLKQYGGDLQRMVTLRGHTLNLTARVERQLGLSQTVLTELLGERLISDMVLLGRDAYVREAPRWACCLKRKQ